MNLEVDVYATNEELRRLKSLYRFTVKDIVELLSGDYGGPSYATVTAWCASATAQNYNAMPAIALYLLQYRLKEKGFYE
jgi:hypothetical protein